jgi:hypothetical protein
VACNSVDKSQNAEQIFRKRFTPEIMSTVSLPYRAGYFAGLRVALKEIRKKPVVHYLTSKEKAIWEKAYAAGIAAHSIKPTGSVHAQNKKRSAR